MTFSLARGSQARGTLLLADISGYTAFLNAVAQSHRALIIEADEPPAAYAAVSTLLDATVSAFQPSFRLAKFEGDAVFAVENAPLARGRAVLDCVVACYQAFREQLALAGSQWTCRCDGCVRINSLDLKFIVHHGDYVVHRISNQEELAGPEVIAAHRLLKNHARDLVGDRPYALLTESAVQALGVPVDGMLPGVEAYDDMAPIEVRVLPLS